MSTQFVWVVAEELSIGTLAEYAVDWESCRQQDITISPFVWRVSSVGDLQMHKVHITFNGKDGSDYLNYSLTVLNDTVCAQIDGRA